MIKYIFGIPIDVGEINRVESQYGGRFVEDDKKQNILYRVYEKYVKDFGKFPGMMRIRDYPESYFIPVIVEVKIGKVGFETNKVLFLEIRRIF